MSSPGMAPDPLAPDLQGQRRVVGIGALLGLAETRARAARRRPAAGRSCPSGSGRGSGPPARASSAGSHAAPRVQRRRVARAAPPAGRSRGRPPSWSAACRRAPPAGSGRSASGWRRSRRDRGRSAGTCRAAGSPRPAARRAPRARPACRGPRAVRAPRRRVTAGPPARRGARRRPRSDRAIRARRGDCSRQKACARLSRPQGARTAARAT